MTSAEADFWLWFRPERILGCKAAFCMRGMMASFCRSYGRYKSNVCLQLCCITLTKPRRGRWVSCSTGAHIKQEKYFSFPVRVLSPEPERSGLCVWTKQSDQIHVPEESNYKLILWGTIKECSLHETIPGPVMCPQAGLWTTQDQRNQAKMRGHKTKMRGAEMTKTRGPETRTQRSWNQD